MTVECPREADVLDAIASRRWPARADDELRAHVGTCASCADLAVALDALLSEREVSWSESVALPSADAVWFRAQARARLEATKTASRPIGLMQVVSLAVVAVLIIVAVIIAASRADTFWNAESTSFWSQLAWPSSLTVDADGTAGLVLRGALLAAALWLVLVPVAVSLVALED
jgi:hypothetical protein